MKRYILALAAIIMAGIVFINISNGKSKAVKEGGILSVNDIQADPYAYKGSITITGVVAGKVKWDPKIFVIVETSEAKICKQAGCAKFYLPVRYEGEMPKEWDEVNITGSFSEGREIIFKAANVDVLRHLTF